MRRREFMAGIASAAFAVPRVVWAQQAGKIPLVGYLWHAASAQEEEPYYSAVVDGFAKLGYVDGRNIKIIHRFADEKLERFKGMARELVAMQPDVLMGGAITTSYLKEATSTIPIVFVFVPDPIGLKLVKSFAQPGGNVTGFVNFGRDLIGKRLQALKEVVPGMSRAALLVHPDQPSTRVYTEETNSIAAELGLPVQIFQARDSSELPSVFDAMAAARVQALITSSGGSLFTWKATIAKLALEHRLPYCGFSKETFDAGALMSYGADQAQMCRDSAVYVDKILKGAAPGELPVQQPMKLQFFINLKVAKAIGVTVPPTLLASADQVIE
jgi:putative ABC transport system substrate-binding protein